VNHFILWVGSASEFSATNRSLLGHYKSIEEASTATGRSWYLSNAAQKDGQGAFRDNRMRLIASKQLFWFGHAWSQTDGPQPAFSLLERKAGTLPNIKLVELAREKSDGVYALALIDEISDELIVAADANGSFHVYYRELSGGIAVSNSSALLAGLPPKDNLDPLGLQELCSNSVANEDRTIWHSVRKLRSGQILKINLSHPRVELIDHRPLLSALDNIQDYADQPVRELFDSISAVLLMLDREGGRGQELRGLPWAADLTGGNDSRALMAAIVANRIHIASTVSGPPSDPDVQIGERLAGKLGIPHFTRAPLGPITPTQFFDVLQLTDGEFDAVEYATVAAVHRQHIRDGLQFSVNGTYGEVARGHAFRLGLPGMLFPDQMASKLKSREPLALDHPSIERWNQLCTLKNPANLFSPEARSTSTDYFSGIFGRLTAYAGHLPQHAQLDLIHTDLRIERWLGRLQSCTNQLWPAITPWGFQAPLARIMSTSPADRRNGLLTRNFTFQYSPILGKEPLYTGNPAMPFSLRYAHKFLPVIPYFADRAWQKVASKFHFGQAKLAPSASERQPLLCADPEIKRCLAEPLLACSGLFDNDVLLKILSPGQPQSARMHQLWCRLLTVEAALRLQGGASIAA
jgi:hypothetical protein